MGAASRAKGARGELEVVEILRTEGWPNARRTHDGRAQAARGDIANGPQGVHLEVKRAEALSVPKALRQAEADAGPQDIPILVHRSSRQPWLATLPLDELLPLLRLRESA